MAEGAAASTSFGVILFWVWFVGLSVTWGVVAVVWFWCSFLLGDIHSGISKFPMLGFCCGCFLEEGGYQSFVFVVGFCAVGMPQTGLGAVAPGDMEVVALLAGAVRRGDFGLGGSGFRLVAPVGVVLAFLGGFWPGVFEGLCFCRPLFYGFYYVVHSWGCVAASKSRPYPL